MAIKEKPSAKTKQQIASPFVGTDLKFFTNEPDATLLQRFNQILRSNTQFFDVLVGYFRTSGFYQLYKSLENVEKIRILVGINADRKVEKLIEIAKGEQFSLKPLTKETKEDFSKDVITELTESEDNYNIEKGVQKFIDFIRSGKLEICSCPSPIHAKMYILRKDPNKSDEYGKVITGSSNFSAAGLRDNLEFNVELKDSPDVKFALQKFEELWENSVDISQTYVDTVQQNTWLNDTITPYELYIKFLYEYLKDEINLDKQEIFKTYRPKEFIDLEYQIEAVLDAKQKLEEYGGVFIADVVGLGKTFVSAMLAEQLDGRNLVICPPVLKDYWKETFDDFKIQVQVESLGQLDKLVEKGTEKYSNIFIDEAHRFRNEITQTYEKLKQICWGKRVILVSATPLNNTPFDILSQLKLFQKGRNSTIPGIKNLDKFFSNLQAQLKKVDRKNLQEYLSIVRSNSLEIREKVLQYVMVRRTRREVQKYFKNDLQKRKVSFPDVAEPKRAYYEFDDILDKTFTETIELIKQLNYARYKPATYLKNPDSQEITAQVNLSRFMKVLLIKRLESSFYAFKKTIGRFINSYAFFMGMLDKGTVYISKRHANKILELLENDDEEKIIELVDEDKARKYKTLDFRKDFKEDLESDIEVLKQIKNLWEAVSDDPKIEKLASLLKARTLKDKKLIIFTESKETADYLDKNLRNTLAGKIVSYSSHSSATIRDVIKENYDPSHYRKKDDIKLLITTDVLAEGVNLHRSSIIINYDIPWNPTRVLQRVGRVNRIGQKQNVNVYNFFPTKQSNDEIKLEEAAISKIQAFHDTLGEDSQYLTEQEEITSYEIFNRLNSKKSITGEDEEDDPKLKYREIIRNIRDNDKPLYEKTKRLPRKARSGRKIKRLPESTVTFFRKGKLRKIFIANNKDITELNFVQAAQILSVEKNVEREKISGNFYNLLSKNKEEFKLATTEDLREFKSSLGVNEKKVVNAIKAIRKFEGFTDDEEEYLDRALQATQEGVLGKQALKELVKAIKKESNPHKILLFLKKGISEKYLDQRLSGKTAQTSKREVILSEYLISDVKD